MVSYNGNISFDMLKKGVIKWQYLEFAVVFRNGFISKEKINYKATEHYSISIKIRILCMDMISSRIHRTERLTLIQNNIVYLKRKFCII